MSISRQLREKGVFLILFQSYSFKSKQQQEKTNMQLTLHMENNLESGMIATHRIYSYFKLMHELNLHYSINNHDLEEGLRAQHFFFSFDKL